jgi:hypothetical protein
MSELWHGPRRMVADGPTYHSHDEESTLLSQHHTFPELDEPQGPVAGELGNNDEAKQSKIPRFDVTAVLSGLR